MTGGSGARTDDSAGELAGELAAELDGDAVDKGRPVAALGAAQAAASAGEVVDEHVGVVVELVEGEDDEVGHGPRRDDAPISEPEGRGLAAGQLVDGLLD